MPAGKFHLLKIAMLLTAFAGLVIAKDFKAPTEGPAAFRRDRVPLDAETMTTLGGQLTLLARGMDAETARHRQAAARMLALATALDPANPQARALITEYEVGSHHPLLDRGKIEQAQSLIWQYIDWLDSAEAGADARALAACLNDVMAVSDSKHPRAQALRTGAEKGAWKDWVAALPDFEETKVIVANPGKTPPVDNFKPSILLGKASVLVPLWLRPKDSAESWSLGVASLEMTATEKKPTGPEANIPFSLVLGNGGGNSLLVSLVPPITKLLATKYAPLPKNCRIVIGGEEMEASLLSKKRHSLSAAAAVLASSALTGIEPQATIIGVIDETGAFKLPLGFWDQLQSLSDGHGMRLVIPAAAADYLPSMLALERPEFFLNYEVVLASNFQELLDLTAKTPADSLAKISTQFGEIRAKAGTTSTNQYVANSFVRRRLEDITAVAPFHASAKMLAIQGAGNRPSFVRRDVLASELRRAVEPMEWLIKRTPDMVFDATKLELLSTSYEDVRNRVDKLMRYADTSDRGLVDHSQEMVATLRPLDRAAHARGEAYINAPAVAAAFTAVVKAYQANAQELATAAGEPEVLPAH